MKKYGFKNPRRDWNRRREPSGDEGDVCRGEAYIKQMINYLL